MPRLCEYAMLWWEGAKLIGRALSAFASLLAPLSRAASLRAVETSRPLLTPRLLQVAVVGNVDAGKSTLVGVLTGPTSFLDDGRGLARSRVLRHKVRALVFGSDDCASSCHGAYGRPRLRAFRRRSLLIQALVASGISRIHVIAGTWAHGARAHGVMGWAASHLVSPHFHHGGKLIYVSSASVLQQGFTAKCYTRRSRIGLPQLTAERNGRDGYGC